MCPVRIIRYLATALCVAWIFTAAARAEDDAATRAPFKVRLERLPFRVTPPLYRAYVTAETGKFLFLIPGGFRIRGESEIKIKLSNLEGNCQIAFSILDPTPSDSQPLNADTYRELLQTRHPKGKIVEQLTPCAAGRGGVGFDMQWETTNKFVQCTRTAFIPSSAGVLEFSATSSPKDFSELRNELNQVINTFQATTPEGKLEVLPISATDGDHTDAGSSSWNGQRQIFFWYGSDWASS